MEKLVAHIGGGDTVYGNADDPMRFAVSKLSHLHCCTAKVYADNLINIGEEDFRVFFTGNPAYVNIKNEPQIPLEKLFKELGFSNKNYILLINHPLSSELFNTKKQTEILLEAVKKFCLKNNYHTICIPPNSDPGSYDLRQIIKNYESENWFTKVETQPREIFVNVVRNASALIGNSSMGILEAPFYKLPVVNVGNRQKGRLNAGNVNFVEHRDIKIIEALDNACLNDNYRQKVLNIVNPFGDEKSAKNISNAIDCIDLSDKKWYIKRKLC